MSLLLDIWLSNPFVAGTVLSVLMLSDIYLTRFSHRLRMKGYNEKIEYEVFELNPRYQEIVHGNLPVPVKEIVIRILTGLFVVVAFLLFSYGKDVNSFLSSPNGMFYEWFLGAVTFIYVGINIIHLQNTAIFNHVRSNPGVITGKVRIGASYTYFSSYTVHSIFSLLWFIAFLLTIRPVFLGGISGEIIIVILTVFQKRKYNKKNMTD